ncbi:MAG: leucine-rich repeat domain-containing protein, partial [Clostridia bacterium]
NAFCFCSSLKEITIPDSVASIGDSAFYGCSSLMSVTIGSGVTSIGMCAFHNCRSLMSVTIPDSVTSIGNNAFCFCSSLKEITIPDSVTSIGDSAFYGCSSLMSVTIPDSVTSIKKSTFYACSGLTSVTIPDSVTSIGDGAFSGCSRLTSIKIPGSVTSIGDDAFFFCSRLTSVKIGSGVESIGMYTFDSCSSLTNVRIPDSVTSIGDGAFRYCSSLMSVTIPNSVTSIGDSAFDVCWDLTDIYYIGSEDDWANISIGSSNDDLTQATIHFKPTGASAGKTGSINNAVTKKIQLIVYENENDSSKASDSYILSKNASVTNNASAEITNEKGLVTIKNDGSNITVSKDKYLTRTLTADRAKQSNKIYLQKNTGKKPIIQAVWIGDTDVYSTDYSIDITSSDKITLEAEVVWKSGSQNKIYLMQEARRVEFSGTSLTTVLSNNFDVSKSIYIVAEDTEGNTTKKKLKFKAGGGLNNVLNDYKLSFGDSVTATIPNSVPVIGGGEVGLDVPMIPLTVTFEDNKFYAVLGLDVKKASEEYSFTENVNGKWTEHLDKETKYLFKNIKDNFKNSADKYSFSKLKTKWMKAKYNYTAKVGFDADFTVIGYLEGYVDSNGKVSVLDGGVGVNPSVKVSASSQIILVPPLYWEAELKGEIEAMVSLYLNETAKNFKPNGTVSGDVTLKGGVGLGASGVVGVSGGLKGNIGVDWDIYVNKQDYVAVSGSIGAYVKAFAGPVTIIDKDFKFAEGIIWDHPSTRVNMMMLDEIDFYNTAEYSLIDRSYAKDESYFTANDNTAELFEFAPQNKIEHTLKTNVYTYSEPQLVEFSDGTMLAVWLDDDSERTAINRTTLLYSYYDGAVWSEPTQIDNDGTGDYSPNLEVINDVAYITWVNASAELNDNADISEMFTVWEISAAVFDKESVSFGNIANITDNEYIDMLPKIFGDESNIQIAWVQNSSNNIFAETDTYSIMTSTLFGNSWSEATAYASKLMPVDSLDGYKYNGNTYIAYSIDLDGDQQDYTDKEIYLNNTRLTNNDVLDSKPVFANDKLYYYSNGNVVEYDLANNTSEIIVESISTDRFSVISDGNNSAVVYCNSDSLITELYAVMYDSKSNSWGESIALTQLESNISSYSGTFSQTGEMKFIVNKTEITGDIYSESPYGQTDLALIEVTPTYNLSIGEAFYHEELILPGNTLEFYVEVINDGELTVDNYMVQVSDEDGNILATTYGEEAILPGETLDFTAYYPLGDDDFNPHNVILTVAPIDVADYDDSDNSTEVYLNYENTSLENLGYGIDTDGNAVIYGDVVNRGYSQVEAVTATLRRGGHDGEIIDTITITEQLGTLDLAPISFTVPFETDAVYYVELNKAGRNSDFVILQNQYDEIISFDKETNSIIIDSAKKVTNVSIIVALYQSGKLLEVKTETVNISEGENVFNSPITDYTDADTVKIMVWDKVKEMEPLFENCFVDLQ